MHRSPRRHHWTYLELSELGNAVSLCPTLNIWDRDAPPESSKLKRWRDTVFNFKELDNAEVNKIRGISSSNM